MVLVKDLRENHKKILAKKKQRRKVQNQMLKKNYIETQTNESSEELQVDLGTTLELIGFGFA